MKLGDIKGIRLGKQKQYGGQKAKITDTGDNEGLFSRIGGCWTMEPEADKEIGAETNQLPKNKHQQQVVSQNQPQH